MGQGRAIDRAGRRRALSWLLALPLLPAAAVAAAAGDAGLDRFVGLFQGQAQGEATDRFFVSSYRDVRVELRREGDGFRLAWSTLIRDAEDAAGQRLRRSELHFIPGPSPRTWRTAAAAEPFTGRPGAWAVLAGNRLTVQVLAIDPAGGWELQTYERTLEGDAMALRFSRLAPGRPELVVTGRLTRQPD
ncbi:MAG: hypothetical protein U1E53_34005 [Dongiaceae bacterium]